MGLVLKFSELKDGLVRLLTGKAEPKRLRSFGQQLLYDKEAAKERRRNHITSTLSFNVFMGINIALASVLLGVELDRNRGWQVNERFNYFLVDIYFTLLYIAELIARVDKLGWDYLSTSWDVFDYALVVIGIADFSNALDTEKANDMKIAATFRVIRGLRIVWFIEGIQVVRGMWLVMRGMIECGKSVFWTAVFVGIVLYGFGVILSTTVGEEAALFEVWELAEPHVGTVPLCIFTTLQVFTFDAWASKIARPLLDKGYGTTVGFFICTIIICNFGILNMIIGLMVERFQAMRQVGLNLKKIDDELLAGLAVHFAKEDENDDGELNKEEFECLIKQPEVHYRLRLLGCHVEEASSLFDLLDVDRSGTLGPEEFFRGLSRLRGEARSVDLMKLVATALRFKKRAAHQCTRVYHLCDRIEDIQERLNGVGKHLTGEMKSRLRMAARKEEVSSQAAHRHHLVEQMHEGQRTFFAELVPEGNEDDDGVEEHLYETLRSGKGSPW